MISNTDIEKSFFNLNRFETIQIYRQWGKAFILFAFSNIVTCLVILFTYFGKINILINTSGFYYPLLTFPPF